MKFTVDRLREEALQTLREEVATTFIRVHHDLGSTVPFMKGGTGHVAVPGSLNLYHRGMSIDERNHRRVYRAGPPF